MTDSEALNHDPWVWLFLTALGDADESIRGLHLRVSGEGSSSRLVRTPWLVAAIHMLIPLHSLHFTAFIFPN